MKKNSEENLTKEEKLKRLEEDLDKLSKGKVAGAALAGLGGALLSGGYVADYLNKTPGPRPSNPNTGRNLKLAGGISIPAGAALVAYASYKKRKLKGGNSNDSDKKRD